MAWYGNSQGHAEAGRKGGKKQGKHNNPGNFANNPNRAREAGRKGGAVKPIKHGGLTVRNNDSNQNFNEPVRQIEPDVIQLSR